MDINAKQYVRFYYAANAVREINEDLEGHKEWTIASIIPWDRGLLVIYNVN